MAQLGGKHVSAKPLKGFTGAGVLEIVEDTYHAVYTTSRRALDMIQSRLRRAEEDDRQH